MSSSPISQTHPSRRRLMAGLACLGLVPASTLKTATAQTQKPECKILRDFGDKMRASAEARFITGMSEYVSNIYLKPANIDMRNWKWFNSPSPYDLELNIGRAVHPAVESKRWQSVSVGVPPLVRPNGETAEWVNGILQLGNTRIWDYHLQFSSNDMLIKRRITVEDQGDQTDFQDLLNDWLKSANGDDDIGLILQSSRNEFDGPVIVWKRKDILNAISKADALLEELKTDMANGKCQVAESSGDCFMTTAACDVIGLDDKCWELETLRHFRDNWLATQPGGAQDIARYYSEAPQIVREIKNRPDADPIWLSLYFRYILPSAILARLGLHKSARKRYSAMMRKMMGYRTSPTR